MTTPDAITGHPSKVARRSLVARTTVISVGNSWHTIRERLSSGFLRNAAESLDIIRELLRTHIAPPREPISPCAA